MPGPAWRFTVVDPSELCLHEVLKISLGNSSLEERVEGNVFVSGQWDRVGGQGHLSKA